jgi:hypothetical protein
MNVNMPKKIFTALCNEGQLDDGDDCEFLAYGVDKGDAFFQHDGDGRESDGAVLMGEYKLVRTFRAKKTTRIVEVK